MQDGNIFLLSFIPVLPVRCTIHGSKCVLPFLYKDKLWTGCVHLWTDRKPWWQWVDSLWTQGVIGTIVDSAEFVETGDN